MVWEIGSLRKTFVEVFSIVLGVLLALGVSEWQQDRDRQEQAAIALENIEGELRWNRDLLQRIHENNAAIMQAIRDSGDAEVEGQLIPGLQIRETAWQAFQATGTANHVDYSLVLSLSATYSMQGVYKHVGQQLAEAAMNMAAYASAAGTTVDNRHFQEQFSSFFEMLVAAEEQLLQSYDETLALLSAG
jgi:hypothetical protein